METNHFAVMNNINQGIVILNPAYQIIYVNPAFCKLLSTDHAKLLHRPIFEVLPAFDQPYVRNSFANALDHDCNFFFSAAMHPGLVPSSTLKLNIRLSRFLEAGAPYLLLEFQNVTSSYKRIEQLQNTVQQLYHLNQKLREKEREIQQLAYYDPLTGVANRVLFYELAKKLVETSKQNQDRFALVFIDIDKFKDINDAYGHEIGDKVLQFAAGLLIEAAQDDDIVARYGGDEFLMLLPKMQKQNRYQMILNKLPVRQQKTALCGNLKIPVSFSIGCSIYPSDSTDVDRLMSIADRAMYDMKRQKHPVAEKLDL